ncbi:hypothetical protein BsWGS_18923 [Bradybaena similaris]
MQAEKHSVQTTDMQTGKRIPCRQPTCRQTKGLCADNQHADRQKDSMQTTDMQTDKGLCADNQHADRQKDYVQTTNMQTDKRIMCRQLTCRQTKGFCADN